MDKNEFIAFYKLLLQGSMTTPSNVGLAIISKYIEEEGNDYHKTHSTEFINILGMIPWGYKYCLKWALDYFSSKYSVVIITQEDPNCISPKLITIY